LLFDIRLGESERCLLTSVSVANIAAAMPPNGTNHSASTKRVWIGLVHIAFWSPTKVLNTCFPKALSLSLGSGCAAVTETELSLVEPGCCCEVSVAFCFPEPSAPDCCGAGIGEHIPFDPVSITSKKGQQHANWTIPRSTRRPLVMCSDKNCTYDG
jgi:hypothetical protein